MIDLQSLNALLQLAERAPKTQAEALWLAALVEKVNTALTEQAKPAPTEPAA